jgi:peptidoglycan glycosyltransferase
MPAPRLVDAITDEYGIILYESPPGAAHRVIKPETAVEMRKLMRETVNSGSASRSFRGFHKRHEQIEVGGKTGSLTGFDPKGKYDWFVGYATDGERKLAYAVLCINKEFWYVKSSQLARRLIEDYFQEAG